MKRSNMNKVSKGTRMTEEEYKNIKQLTDTELKQSVIARISQRSAATVGMIRKSTDFKDYRTIVDEHVAKIYERQEAKAKLQKVETVQMPEAPLDEATETFNEAVVKFVTDTDRVLTSVNNLTQAVLTMTSVLNRIAENTMPQNSKSFFRK